MKWKDLDDSLKDAALDSAWDIWWESDDGRAFREAQFFDYEANFLETTGLVDYQDVVLFDADANKMAWRGSQSDPVAEVSWTKGPSWNDGSRLTAALKHVVENEVLSQWASGITTYADPDELDDIATDTFDGIAEKAAFHFFNWLDLQDAGWEYLRERFEDGDPEVAEYEFDAEGHVLT